MKIPLVAVFPPQAVSVASNVRLTIGPPKATMAMHHIGLGSWYGGRAVPLAGWFFWWRKNERQKKMDENWGFWWNFLWYKMNWNQWYLGVKSEMIRKWPWNWRPLWEPRKMMKMMTNPSRRFWGVPLKFSQPNKYPILSYIRGWFFATSVYGVGDCFFFGLPHDQTCKACVTRHSATGLEIPFGVIKHGLPGNPPGNRFVGGNRQFS